MQSTDATTIMDVIPLTTQSWIGQNVTLKCVADGVPTPTITWKKPSGVEIRKITSTENSVDEVMENDQDFGQYTCEATNGIGAVVAERVQVKQISE